MPLKEIKQAKTIEIADNLRLTKYKGECSFALPWYQDLENLWMMEGHKDPYTPEVLQKMLDWQNDNSELYIIEIFDNGSYRPIGDIAFSPYDMAIVIGDKSQRGKKIAQCVMQNIINRAKFLGIKELIVNDVCPWNKTAQYLMAKFGFKETALTKNGYNYKLEIM